MTNQTFSLGVRSLVTKTSLIVGSLAFIAMPVFAHATITRQLQTGMSGADVSEMQTYFAQDPTIYPQGIVSGYFGFLTKSAVSNFQSANGLPAVGRVGPATLPVLNFKMSAGMSTGSTAPEISAVNINASNHSAVVSWNTNESAKGLVYFSSTPLTTYESINSVAVSGATAMTDSNYRTSQDVTLSNLQSDTVYYYLIYTTDQSGNVSVTWPASFHMNN
jgi:peptidoglycan hydrolase-like protein with peptidoglycan-binding domain